VPPLDYPLASRLAFPALASSSPLFFLPESAIRFKGIWTGNMLNGAKEGSANKTIRIGELKAKRKKDWPV